MKLRLLKSVVLLAIGLVLAVGVLEVGLRMWPNALGPALGNRVHSKYGGGPGDLYYDEPIANILVMKRNYSDAAYFNSFRWQHSTDENGFRNAPEDRPKDVLLLGDSVIYGHGVELKETASHLLRERGVNAYNMAQQGTGLYQEYVLFRTYLERFAPQSVLLFALENDLHDIQRRLPYASVEEVVHLPEIETFDYESIYDSVMSRNDNEYSAGRRFRYGLKTYRLWRAFKQDLKQMLEVETTDRSTRAPSSPAYMDTLLSESALAIGQRYYEQILTDMAERCAARGVKFRVVHLFLAPLGPGEQPGQGLANFSRLVEQACEKTGVKFHDTRELFAGRKDCFLKADGHLTVEGNRVLADFLIDEVL